MMSTEVPIETTSGLFNDTNVTADVKGDTDIEIWSKNIRFWSFSVMIPTGLLFNMISVPVFMSKHLRVRSASWYLAALGISDSLTLLTCCFDYWIGIPVTKTSPVWCVVNSYLSHACRLFSAVLVTSFTVERFICVVKPLKRASLSKPGRTRKLIALQAFLCALCTTFVLFTVETNVQVQGRDPECDVKRNRTGVYIVCTTLFLLLGSILVPILVIFTLNAFMMRKLCMRKASLTHTSSNSHVGFAKLVRRHSFNTATLLLVVSTSFVILNIPYCVSFLMLFLQTSGLIAMEPGPLGNLFAVKYLTSVPYHLNYCINFLLYNVCARAFRVEMGRFLSSPCRMYKNRHLSRNRSSTFTRTMSERFPWSSRSRSTMKHCNQFFMVPNCGGYCIRPETSSFAVEPANVPQPKPMGYLARSRSFCL